MSSTVVDVESYAAGVRAALVGLSPEVVEDLTDGLEANLAAAMADGIGSARTAAEVFGPPEDYAAELRAAAGLDDVVPPRPRRSVGEWLAAPFRGAARLGHALLARLRTTRWWPPVEDLLVAMRPVWWLARGWVVWNAVWGYVGARRDGPLPANALGWLTLAVLVAVSAQWGRGRWRTGRIVRGLLLTVSTVAAFAVLPLLVWLANPSTATSIASGFLPDGVWVDGVPAQNLFVYGADGTQVPGAQIFDQDGRPVLLYGSGAGSAGAFVVNENGSGYVQVPADSATGGQAWNSYPLASVPATSVYVNDANGSVQIVSPGTSSWVAWPFARVTAVTPLVSPSATASPTPGATTSATPAPLASDSAAPTPTAGDGPTGGAGPVPTAG